MTALFYGWVIWAQTQTPSRCTGPQLVHFCIPFVQPYLAHDREGDTVVPSREADDFLPRAWLATPELVAREGDHGQLFLGVIGPKRLKLTIMSVRVFAMASDVHDEDYLRFVSCGKAA